MKAGDRVIYIGDSGIGLPFPRESGYVQEILTSGGKTLARVALADITGKYYDANKKPTVQIQLPVDQFKSQPIIIPVAAYTVGAILAITLTWKIFNR